MPDLMVAKDNVDNGVRRGGDEHADQLRSVVRRGAQASAEPDRRSLRTATTSSGSAPRSFALNR